MNGDEQKNILEQILQQEKAISQKLEALEALVAQILKLLQPTGIEIVPGEPTTH